MNKNVKTTLKAWQAITAVTLGLSFLTQGVAKLFGIDLPEQMQVTIVRANLLHAFDDMDTFLYAVKLLLNVLIIYPALEEVIFRWAGWRLPVRMLFKGKPAATWMLAAVSAAVFSMVHNIDFAALKSEGEFKWIPMSSAFVALFFFGLAQCWLYRKTDRIWCPMLNHFLFNLTNLALLFVLPQ